MTERPEPIDPELAVLLDAERDAQPPGAALDRVWSNIASSVAAGGPGDARATSTRGGSAGGAASHTALLVTLALVVGGAIGAVGAIVLRKPTVRVVYVDRPVAASPRSAEVPNAVQGPPEAVAGADPDGRVATLPPLPPRPRPAASRIAPAPSPPAAASSLPAERAILDEARTALAHDDGAHALALTDAHARRFAHPQLGEEREAIAIQALVLQGRYDEARERAKQFRAASPDSLFMPAVNASLASIENANP